MSSVTFHLEVDVFGEPFDLEVCEFEAELDFDDEAGAITCGYFKVVTESGMDVTRDFSKAEVIKAYEHYCETSV